MEKYQFPKVLIVSRNTWDDDNGGSSTLSNIFADYDSYKLAHIYIESKHPCTICCKKFFQISEFSLIKKLYKWNTKTGFIIDSDRIKSPQVSSEIVAKEASVMAYVRSHRSHFFSFLREVLWGVNAWKSKELRQFILDFNPDVIWLDGSPLPLMNKLFIYVINIAKKPTSIFMQDDVYTYESCGKSVIAKIRKSYLRFWVRKVVAKCDNMFVASPKMKKEYDNIFKLDSIFIAKSIDFKDEFSADTTLRTPIRMVYLGHIVYGRIYSLIEMSKILKRVNKDCVKIQLFIYTDDYISDEDKDKLLDEDSVFLMDPVLYKEVPGVISQNDVLLFVESFDSRYNKLARLSFSTKICDYLASRKCILAVGPSDSAPIEYFKNENAAIVATSIDEIEGCIQSISNPQVVSAFVEKAKRCAIKNHNRADMNNRIYGTLIEISKINKFQNINHG